MVDWTQVLLAAITMIGTVTSAFFASRAGRHSKRAKASADVAVAASLRPPEGE
jgi:ABC-type molybdate transport system substrate-binding protein